LALASSFIFTGKTILTTLEVSGKGSLKQPMLRPKKINNLNKERERFGLFGGAKLQNSV